MQRCINLASLGAGRVTPNPMVGAVLVHENEIIGEGYHEVYGQAHAEVNCLNSVPANCKQLIGSATLYVSLEPCAHFGKTPPCADLVIRSRIPRVVIGCRDPFKQVDGKGIEKLKAAGIEVVTGVLEQECRELNKRFFTFHTQHRPYILLKWAQTKNGIIGNQGNNRLLITNEFTNRVVHRWRSEEAGIMVGTNTALMDNPLLTNRLWSGARPVRIVIDKFLQIPGAHHLLDKTERTIVFNIFKHEEEENLLFYQVTEDVSLVHQVINALYQMQIQSVMLEGGARITQSFLDEGAWDEARIITNSTLAAAEGVRAPVLDAGQLIHTDTFGTDTVAYYRNFHI